jgi:NADH:ubiquinone oxidoreductase subunit 2 (subunit N)
LLGFSFIYLSFGSLSFELLFSIINTKPLTFVFLGFIFVISAFLFKTGAAPFHAWLCDVYDGSILSVTFLFAAMPKIVLFSLIIKIYFFISFDFLQLWSSLLIFVSVASIAVGSISAIYQKRVKRLFAYSTVSHTGFILLGILVCSPFSAKSLIFYIFIYSFLTILLFSILIYASISTDRSIKFIAN